MQKAGTTPPPPRQRRRRRDGGASSRHAKKMELRRPTVRRLAARIPNESLTIETQQLLEKQQFRCAMDRFTYDVLKLAEHLAQHTSAKVSKDGLLRTLARFFHPRQREAALDDFVRILPRLRPDEVRTFLRVVTSKNEADLRAAIQSVSKKPNVELEDQAVQALDLETPKAPARLPTLLLNGVLLFLIFGLLFLVDGGVGLMAAGLVSLAAAVIAVVDTTYRVNADSYGLLVLVLAVGNGALLAVAGEPLFASTMTSPVLTTIIGGVAALAELVLLSFFKK